MEEKTSLKEVLGCLPQALLGNFVVGALALTLGIALGGPKIYIEQGSATYIFCILLVVYLAITWWSIFALAKLKGNLVTGGPYRFVRHPMYAAIIFILNPALAIVFRSWWLMLAVLPIYFIWRACAKKEEKQIKEKFPNYFEYRRRVWMFFPNLAHINKIHFYATAGAAFFLITFIALNFPALYLRWAVWKAHGEIVYDQPTNQKTVFNPSDNSNIYPNNGNIYLDNSAYALNYNARANSILIGEIWVDAPLVPASGTSQNELNSALNQGVVIYPGSALPGQNGEVFLTGHSSVYPWNKTSYGQVFTLLDKLEAGDTVSLIYNNRQYDYLITGKEILLPNQVKISETSEPRLTLFTCWPIGTSLKRLLVRGELIR